MELRTFRNVHEYLLLSNLKSCNKFGYLSLVGLSGTNFWRMCIV